MISSRPISSAILVLMMTATAIPAAAQGIFDKPPIAGAAPDAAVSQTAPAAAKGPLDFISSPELRAENQQKLLTELATLYPDLARDLEGQDLIGLIAPALQAKGLKVDNLGDAFATWLLTNYTIVKEIEEEPTAAQIEGTKKLSYDAMLALPDLQKMSDADKQSTAEALLLQAAINELMVDARKEHNPAGLPEALEEVRSAARQSGIDLDKFVMTPNGLALAQ